jgi:hypothetical protein
MPAKATADVTFSPPETVTIPGEIALEALALLDAFAGLMADFRLDGESDPFYRIEDSVWKSLAETLGYKDGNDFPISLWEAMKGRSEGLADQIRSHFDGPALGAIAATKMAHDISEVKVRLECIHA